MMAGHQGQSKKDKLILLIGNQSLDINTINAIDEVNAQYETKVQQDIKTKAKFYKNFKSHEVPTQTTEETAEKQISTLMEALDKLTYFPERRDTLGVALTLTTLTRDISQLEDVLQDLQKDEKRSAEDCQKTFDLNSIYKFVLETVRKEQEEGHDESSESALDEEGELRAEIEKVKIRYDQLRKDLQYVEICVRDFEE